MDKEALPTSDRASKTGGTAFAPGSRASAIGSVRSHTRQTAAPCLLCRSE